MNISSNDSGLHSYEIHAFSQDFNLLNGSSIKNGSFISKICMMVRGLIQDQVL